MDSSHNSYDFWPEFPKNGIVTMEKLNYVYSSDSEEFEIELATLRWSLEFCQSNEKVYSVILQCWNESSLWKCDVELKAKFINGSESHIIKKEQQYSSARNKLTLEIKFDSEAKNVSVDVWINVKNVKGVRCFRNHDLLDEVPEMRDVVLVIDGRKLKVNRAYLAHFSPYFQKLFFGDYSERNQKEIELKDVIFEEFVELMKVISPDRKGVTDDNVEYLLKLADRFDIQTTIFDCEAFLVYDSEFDYVKTLFLAEKYLLVNLQDKWVQTATKEDLKSVRESELYPELSDSTKVALFEASYRLLMEDQSTEDTER